MTLDLTGWHEDRVCFSVGASKGPHGPQVVAIFHGDFIDPDKVGERLEAHNPQSLEDLLFMCRGHLTLIEHLDANNSQEAKQFHDTLRPLYSYQKDDNGQWTASLGIWCGPVPIKALATIHDQTEILRALWSQGKTGKEQVEALLHLVKKEEGGEHTTQWLNAFHSDQEDGAVFEWNKANLEKLSRLEGLIEEYLNAEGRIDAVELARWAHEHEAMPQFMMRCTHRADLAAGLKYHQEEQLARLAGDTVRSRTPRKT